MAKMENPNSGSCIPSFKLSQESRQRSRVGPEFLWLVNSQQRLVFTGLSRSIDRQCTHSVTSICPNARVGSVKMYANLRIQQAMVELKNSPR